jgi:hypothetical protein
MANFAEKKNACRAQLANNSADWGIIDVSSNPTGWGIFMGALMFAKNQKTPLQVVETGLLAWDEKTVECFAN